MARAEDRDRPPVERRDAPDPESLGGGHEDRVGQSRPMLGGLAEELAGATEVGFCRGDEPDRTTRDCLDDAQRRLGTELPLKDDIDLAEGQRSEQQRLVGPPEPGERSGVIEVRGVSRGDDRTGVEQDGDACQRRLGRGSAGRRPASPRTIERPSSESRPFGLRPIARNGSSVTSAFAASQASSAAAITAVFVVLVRRAKRSSR